MIRTGRVVEIKGDRLMVCFERLEACEKCGACFTEKKQTLVSVLGDAEVGNIVDVELPDNRVLGLSVIMYVIPLVGLVIGLFLGNSMMGSEMQALVMGLVFMALSFFAVKSIDKKVQKLHKWQPHIVSVRKSETE